MSNSSGPDDKLRNVLTELASGRLLVDEALAEVKRLSAAPKPQAAGTTHVKSSGKPGGGLIVAVVFLLIGGIFSAVGGGFAVKSIRFQREGLRAPGTVVRLQSAGKGNTKPVVKYVVDGKSYETIGTLASKPAAFDVGEKVDVFYMPDNPEHAQINGFVERWLFPTIFGGIGALLFVIGLFIVLGAIVRRLFRPLSADFGPPPLG